MSDHTIEVLLVEIASRLDEIADNELRLMLARQEQANARVCALEESAADLGDEVRDGRDEVAALRNEIELMRRDLGRVWRDVA